MHFLLVLLQLQLVAGHRTRSDADSLAGIWGTSDVSGPALRGELRLSRGARGWRGDIAGAVATAPGALWAHERDSVVLRFRDGSEFRALAARGARSIRGFWVQPPGHRNRPRYATPVVLSRTAALRWTGVVRPLEERVSVYLDVRRDSLGTLTALLRNPEGNVGDALFDVTRSGNRLELRNAQDNSVLEARWNGRDVALTIAGFPALTLRRMEGRSARGFFPRPPAGGYVYRAPARPQDGLDVSSPADAGMDAAPLLALVRSIASIDARRTGQPLVHSLLVAFRGKLVLEEYFHGFDASTPHDLRSASKTFVSILAGVVGLPGATPVYASLARYAPFANPDPRKDRMTLAHLLTMTSGLACDDNDPSSPGGEAAMQSQEAQPDWYKFALDLPMARAPGDTAAYCSAGINLAGGMVRDRAREWLPSVLDTRLMQPLGIAHYHVNLTPTGEAYMGGGLYLRPRDLMKIGVMYLQGGRWHETQIVPRAWIEESTRLHPEINRANRDAYMWHTNTIQAGGRQFAEIEANGNGGQLLMLVPELELAVVITAGNYNAYGIWRRFRDEWLPQYVIPAAVLSGR